MSQSMNPSYPLYRLRIAEQPPPHVFLEEWFSIALVLEHHGGADIPHRTLSNVDGLTFQTNVKLNYEPTPRLGTADVSFAKLILASSTPSQKAISDLKTGNTSTLSCKVEGMISDDSVVTVAIEIFLLSNDVRISCVYTHPIHLVKYKLGIDPYGWEDVWYKDEGAGNKYMTARVYLHQKSGSLAFGQPIPFHVTIHYDDDEATLIEDQSILRMLGATTQFIDQDKGMAFFEFRVEDLSVYHNGHDFKLMIAADDTIYNVAPTFSPEFNVRSHPYKKQRKLAPCELPLITFRPQETIESTASSSFNRHKDGRSQQRTTCESLSPALESDAVDLRIARSALNNILAWANQVISNLQSIQWKVIGYETNPTVSIDYSTLIFDSQNPNEVITKILSTFSSSAQSGLKMLVSILTESQEFKPYSEYVQDEKPILLSSTIGISGEMVSQFTYLMVKKYSSSRTKKVLGYPAFDEDRYVIGFFDPLTPSLTADHFKAIELLRDDFDGTTDQEILAQILKEAIGCQSKDIYCVTNFDSLRSLLETASANSIG